MIVSVVETFDGRDSETAENFERQYTRTFIVECDIMDESQTEDSIKVAVDPNTGLTIPAIGDLHPRTLATGPAFVRHVDAKQRTDSPWLWTVTVEYSSVKNPSAANPFDRPPDIEIGEVTYQVAAEKGTFLGIDTQDPNLIKTFPGFPPQEDVKVCNSAGDPFDPPIMVDQVRTTLRITRNLRSFPWEQLRTHRGRLNADRWLGFAKLTVKLMGITGTLPVEGNDEGFKTTWVFHIRDEDAPLPDGNLVSPWLDFLLDCGMRKLNADGTKPVAIRDDNSVVVSSPWPLDGKGHKLNDRNSSGEFRVYNFQKSANFSGAGGLGLDDVRLRL